jgi:hypothetical protein
MGRVGGWASVLVVGCATVLSGCARTTPRATPVSQRPAIEAGSRRDAVLVLPAEVEQTAKGTSFAGDLWCLTVRQEAGWRKEPEAGSTLRLAREADGVTAVLRLRVYAIRPGMDARTFLAAHAMWLAEERAPRIEYTWDKDLKAWQGYAVGPSQETYYVFRLGEGRAYVLEESAEAGALSARAADEFQRIAADFEVRPASHRAEPRL